MAELFSYSLFFEFRNHQIKMEERLIFFDRSVFALTFIKSSMNVILI